jgi:hypothetical protein
MKMLGLDQLSNSYGARMYCLETNRVKIESLTKLAVS